MRDKEYHRFIRRAHARRRSLKHKPLGTFSWRTILMLTLRRWYPEQFEEFERMYKEPTVQDILKYARDNLKGVDHDCNPRRSLWLPKPPR